jgi:hypothetical protein
MSVIVDQDSLEAADMGLYTVGALLSHLFRERRLVVRLVIDGEAPNLEQLNAIKAMPLAGRTVYIETADPRQTALDSIQQVAARLNDADGIKDAAADLLRENKWPEAMARLSECVQRWQDAQRTVLAVTSLFKIDLDRLAVSGRPLAQLLGEFAVQLRDIHSAVQSNDSVGLTDLLAYETEQTARQWQAALQVLATMIAPPPAVQSAA